MTKRVGLAAPHPAAHKCAIVPFRLPKRLFAYIFAESLHDFAKQGHKRPGMRTAARFFWYSAREMFHAVVKVKHYILWSFRPLYLQKILENLTFVPFLPLSPSFRRSWIGQNNDFGLFGRRWAKKWHLLHEKPTPSLESAHFSMLFLVFPPEKSFPQR